MVPVEIAWLVAYAIVGFLGFGVILYSRRVLLPRARQEEVRQQDGDVVAALKEVRESLSSIVQQARLGANVALAPDGRTAVSAGEDGSVKVWDLGTGALVRTFRGRAGPIRSVTVAADGDHVISSARDGTIEVWDLDGETGTQGAVNER